MFYVHRCNKIVEPSLKVLRKYGILDIMDIMISNTKYIIVMIQI